MVRRCSLDSSRRSRSRLGCAGKNRPESSIILGFCTLNDELMEARIPRCAHYIYRRWPFCWSAIAVLSRRAAGGASRSPPAADLNYALKDLAASFEKKTGDKVTLSFGSSGNLFSQIQGGAPYDLFFSADMEYPRKLATAGLVETFLAADLCHWPSGALGPKQRSGPRSAKTQDGFAAVAACRYSVSPSPIRNMRLTAGPPWPRSSISD